MKNANSGAEQWSFLSQSRWFLEYSLNLCSESAVPVESWICTSFQEHWRTGISPAYQKSKACKLLCVAWHQKVEAFCALNGHTPVVPSCPAVPDRTVLSDGCRKRLGVFDVPRGVEKVKSEGNSTRKKRWPTCWRNWRKGGKPSRNRSLQARGGSRGKERRGLDGAQH